MKNIDHNTSNLAFNITLGRIGRIITVLLIILTSALTSKAQLAPFQSSYFQNRYFLNPAMAGVDKGLGINLGYRQQLTSFPGAPKNQSLTASYYATDRVGLGLNVTNDQSGLLRQTRVMATYAYHIPLNKDDDKLSFGLSLGVNSPSVDYTNVNGDQGDTQITDYNQLKAYVDGDLGVAYTMHNLSIEGTLPNLKTVFFKNSADVSTVDRTVFLTSVRYKMFIHSVTLEPLVVFRNVKGYDDIFDVGASLNLTDYGVGVEGIYHTSQSFGLGLAVGPKAFRVNLAYNLETGAVRTYSTGGFEFGLKLKL